MQGQGLWRDEGGCEGGYGWRRESDGAGAGGDDGVSWVEGGGATKCCFIRVEKAAPRTVTSTRSAVGFA